MIVTIICSLVSFIIGSGVGIYLYLWKAASLSDEDIEMNVWNFFKDAIHMMFSI